MQTPAHVEAEVLRLRKEAGLSERRISDAVGIGKTTVHDILVRNHATTVIINREDKKIGKVSWRDWNKAIGQMQELKHAGSWSQEEGSIVLGDGKSDVALMCFSDMHMGAFSTDHGLLEKFTNELLEIDNLYAALVGDYTHHAIKMRSVLEVSDNCLPPEQQTDYFESWLEEVEHKVACACWENHAIERQEKQAGESGIKRILSRRVTYFNGIGHVAFKVGEQEYLGAISHKYRGRSIENPVHGQMRYMRREGIDREFAFGGDTHTAGMNKYTDGMKVRVAVNSGSIQLNSGYAKRYFSLYTWPVYPILVFHHDRHCITPYWSVGEWLGAKK